jgi:adenine deaminase
VADGEVVAEVPCPIGGLLSHLAMEEVATSVEQLEVGARSLGVTLPKPFMAMSFLALSVIPELKLTDRGLVDTNRFELVELAAE